MSYMQKPETCRGCALFEKGRSYVATDGMGRNGVMLLGEAPGADEAVKGLPFVGAAGFQLNKALQRTRLERNDFLITNCVRCQPPNNWLESSPWEYDAVLHCDQYLRQAIQSMRPKVIVPMGNVALRSCLGRRGIQELRGYVYETRIHDHTCHVISTLHPAFILRGKDNLSGIQIYDLQRAVRTSRDGYREPEVRYIERPTAADLWAYLEEARGACDRGDWLAADIETPTSGSVTEDEYGDVIDAEILRISFSFRAHTGITVTWTNEHFAFIEAMLGMPWKFVLWWNKEFDIPRIKSKGVTIAGPPLDGMEAWRWTQSDLSGFYGLGSAATFFTEVKEWKSLSSEFPEYYSVKDSDVTIQCVHGIKALLEKDGRWEPFVRHVLDVDPLLQVMGRGGVLIDLEQRAAFRARLQAELDDVEGRIRAVIPRETRRFKVRKIVPPDAQLGELVRALDNWVWDVNDAGEWGERQLFLYNESTHLIRYMQFRGHPVPKHHKTQKDTTEAGEIERLAKRYPKDPVYPLIIEARERRKLISTYIDGQQPDADLRLRTHLGFKPATGRLNHYDANVANQPKHGDLAKSYRKQFVPAPDHLLVELDYKAAQAVIIGYLAMDMDFLRAAKLGVHAILASHVLHRKGQLSAAIRLDSPTSEIKQTIKWIKAEHMKVYNDCKHVVYGSSFGGTAFKMHMDFPDSFPTKRSAEEMQQIYFSTIGRGVKAWQTKTLEQAHRQCYLESPFKQRHYFWNVFAWDSKRRCMGWGPDAKDALAFLPQAIERCVQTEAIKRIFARGYGNVLRWPIHDSLLCEVPVGRANEVIGVIQEEMTRSVPELGGLAFEVDVKVSDKSWAEEDMEDWKG
jgi:uracil-DNA glycosylase